MLHIAVSYDGTWHKRGHSSLYGLGLVIDILTGLVVDYELLSRYCPVCSMKKKIMSLEAFNSWYEEHARSGRCEKNFDGSANAMEAAAAEILWKRSIKMCNFKYTTILSDGDAKTYKHLQNLCVYGNDDLIQKEERIKHVAKRVNKGLRQVVEDYKKRVITLGGKKQGI